MTPEEIIEGILRVNGQVWIEGDILRYVLPADLHWIWVPLMKDAKAELMVLVARRERETQELEQIFNLQDERQTVDLLERKSR
jgi:hypothetical protein